MTDSGCLNLIEGGRPYCKPMYINTDMLGCPPSQVASDHQDYEPFLGSGIPIIKPSFPLLLGRGTTQMI